MNTVTVTPTELLSRIATLENEKADLETLIAGIRAKEVDCAETLRGLLTRNAQLEKEKKPAFTYRKRPRVVTGRTVQGNVGCGPLYITLNEDPDGRPFEVFFKLGKSGSCQQSYLEALGVAISVGLRYGADPMKYVEKLEGMRCPSPRMRDSNGPATLSCADAISQGIAQALELALIGAPATNEAPAPSAVAEPAASIDLVMALAENRPAPAMRLQTGVGMCPKCGGNLVNQGGCTTCLSQCGWAGKCG